jgi:hypothetical protein
MPMLELTDQECQQVINWIATRVVWAECNGVLMKIGDQLRVQQQHNPASKQPTAPLGGNGQEAHHE